MLSMRDLDSYARSSSGGARRADGQRGLSEFNLEAIRKRLLEVKSDQSNKQQQQQQKHYTRSQNDNKNDTTNNNDEFEKQGARPKVRQSSPKKSDR